MQSSSVPAGGNAAAEQPGAQQPGGDYNIVPYTSVAFPQSQPARLAALGVLFGLSPPAVETARVLELGCAAGGNIIPHAQRFPRARFLGIDLSVRHVEEGRQRIASLGLGNIEIRQGDLTEVALEGQSFDYIICHGVYSWVPPAARDAILRISAENLAPTGIAYVSYNVFPGWQMRNIVRDIMLYHAGESGPPRERIAKARWVLEQMAKFSQEASPYGALLRQEGVSLATAEDSYILGEFLARENAPCYFRDFAAAAEARGLTYLCEANVADCIAENRGAEVGALIRTMSANKLIPLEQYIDFFVGRPFRQTLLVQAQRAGSIKRTLVPDRARTLHVSGQLIRDQEAGGAQRRVYKGAGGGTVTAGSQASAEAIEALAAAYPETRTLADLVQVAAPPDLPGAAQGEAAILDALFKMILAGLVTISTVPVRVGGANVDKPVAWPLARADAAAGRSWTTNPRHETVSLDVVKVALLPHLDGSHDRGQLGERLHAAVQAGRITLTDRKSGEVIREPAALDTAVREQVSLAVDGLAAAGLLEPKAASKA
jgi:SAM-dependent methyltransferase